MAILPLGYLHAARINFTAGNPAVADDVNANFIELYNAKWTLTGADLSYGAGNIGIGVATPGVKLGVVGGSAITNSTTGFAILGATGGTHLSFDSTQIQGWSNTTAASLSLNPLGGNIITGSGNLGVGTTPAAKLHVDGGSAVALTAGTGYAIVGPSGGAHLALSTNQVQAKATATTAADVLINPLGGNVGIGTASPAYKLDVNGEFNAATYSWVSASSYPVPLAAPYAKTGLVRYGAGNHPINGVLTFQGGGIIYSHASGANSQFTIDRFQDGAFVNTLMAINITGDLRIGGITASPPDTGCIKTAANNIITGSCTSDGRLKKNIEPLKFSLAKIAALRPVSYLWNRVELDGEKLSTRLQYGLIAQEVEKVFPEMVVQGADGYKRVNYGVSLHMHMLQAIRELKSEKDTQVLALEKRAADAEQKYTALLKQMQHEKTQAEARAAKLELRLARLEASLEKNRVVARR